MGIRLERVEDSAITVCAEAFISDIRVTVQAADILAADVFVTGIFHLHLMPRN